MALKLACYLGEAAGATAAVADGLMSAVQALSRAQEEARGDVARLEQLRGFSRDALKLRSDLGLLALQIAAAGQGDPAPALDVEVCDARYPMMWETNSDGHRVPLVSP